MAAKPKLPLDDFIQAIRPDPSVQGENLKVLKGFLGKSSEKDSVRVYFDEALNHFVDFKESDILHAMKLSAEVSPLGGCKIWVRGSATYTYGDPAKKDNRPKAQFLQGPLAPGLQPGQGRPDIGRREAFDTLFGPVCGDSRFDPACNPSIFNPPCGDSIFGPPCEIDRTIRPTCIRTCLSPTCLRTCLQASCQITCNQQRSCFISCGRPSCIAVSCNGPSCLFTCNRTCAVSICNNTCLRPSCFNFCDSRFCQVNTIDCQIDPGQGFNPNIPGTGFEDFNPLAGM